MMDLPRSAWWKLKSISLRFKILGVVLILFFVWNLLLLSLMWREFQHIFAQNTNAVAFTYQGPILIRIAFLFILGLLIICLLCILSTNRFIIQPLKKAESVLRLIHDGDFSTQIDIWANDEIGKIQSEINALAIDTKNTENGQSKLSREFRVVIDLTETITIGRGVEEIINNMLRQTIKMMKADAGTLFLLNEDKEELVLKAIIGVYSSEFIHEVAIRKLEETPNRYVIETGCPLIVEDISSELPSPIKELIKQEGLFTWASAPIKANGQVIGVINLGKRTKISFTTRDTKLMEAIGSIIGLIINNSFLVEALRSKERELRWALNKAVESQEEERKRLSRELHDGIGQALTSLLIRLKALQLESDLHVVNNRLNGLRLLTSETIKELRRIALDLRPTALDDLGIVAALEWYIQQCLEYTTIPIIFNKPNLPNRLSSEVEIVLYRVAQEGLINAIRYSNAQQIEITLEADDNLIRLMIYDNGKGFNPKIQKKGIGLVGIRERVELLKGKTWIETRPGAGTRLWIEIPLIHNEVIL